MQLGMIGLGRMGGNMSRRLMKAGHGCVAYDIHADAVRELAKEGAVAAASMADFAGKLAAPRVVWIMVPAAVVDRTVQELAPLLSRGDILIDGGNSHYLDDMRRAEELAARGLHYVDVGTSGGVWGLANGYCLMIGGEDAVVRRVEPIFAALAPGADSAPDPRSDAHRTARQGYLHCGPSGAGHFVKMVHNGIEYGLMAAYAEGLNLLKHANVGKSSAQSDAETAPLEHPQAYRYDFDVAAIAEVWRHGSVVRSWLLDLTAEALLGDSQLARFEGHVSDSGEGRWTIKAAIDASVPVPVLSAALYQRFSSRGEADFANRLLSAMRSEFGGHAERGAAGKKA